MPSAEEDKAWWAAALVLAGIEPAVTNAMRAATDIALPSSRKEEEVGDRILQQKAPPWRTGLEFGRGGGS